jgi:hypothetical protein
MQVFDLTQPKLRISISQNGLTWLQGGDCLRVPAPQAQIRTLWSQGQLIRSTTTNIRTPCPASAQQLHSDRVPTS